MKKRLLIVSHALELGGAERSLIGLLGSLDPDQWEIDLFLLRHEGELLTQIPNHIRLLPEVPAYTVLARPMKETLMEGHLLLTAARLLGKIAARAFDKKHGYCNSDVALEYSHKYTCPLMPKIQSGKQYDLAISFLTPHYFVAQKANAKKKIAWIHTDYTKIQVDTVSEMAMWGAYDHIVSISDAVTESFSRTFPVLKDKLMLIRNILPEQLIQNQTDAFSADAEMPRKGIRLLSIGRFCTAKNFDNIPDICRKLISQGADVYWYLIGYGPDETLIRAKIAESGVENRVILLGKKDNPYPYIKACDLYVQPSRFEGNCVCVREAQLLEKPVVITRYATSASQLEDGVDGIIVPMDNDGCASGIAALLNDPDMMQQLSVACASRNYNNSRDVEKLMRLIDMV